MLFPKVLTVDSNGREFGWMLEDVIEVMGNGFGKGEDAGFYRMERGWLMSEDKRR